MIEPSLNRLKSTFRSMRSAAPEGKANTMRLRVIDQGILSHQPGRSVIMPAITQLAGKSLIACQNVGSGMTSSDHTIEVLKSDDSGKSWRNLGSVVRKADQRTWSYRGAIIDALPGGRLVMTASRFEATPGSLFDFDSEALKRPEAVLLWSEDHGETWSPPQIVPVDLPSERYTWNGSGKLMRFSPWRWMYPLETWKPEGFAGPPDQKAAAVFSEDQGRTWRDFTIIADDVTGRLTWWDQQNTLLADGRAYVMLWTHRYGTNDDLAIHWVVSDDQGRTWSPPRPTNLMGQVCCPIALPDGRVAAVYNYRHDPQGVRLAVSKDLVHFDPESELVVFDAKSEATLGKPEHENFLAEHQKIGFGKPYGTLLSNGSLLICFWCTVNGVTHTRWATIGL